MLLVTTLPTAWLGLALWPRRRAPGAAPLAVAAILVAAWLMLAAVEITSQNQAVQLVLSTLAYVSQALLPVVWLLVVVEITGHEPRLRRVLPWLFVVPVVTVALALTNHWHGLLSLDASASAGPWYWVQTDYSFLLTAASLALLVLAWRAAPAQRGQLATLLAATLAPLAWIAVGAFQPLAAPLVLGLSVLVVVWGLLSFHLFDVTPLAQAAVVAGLRETVVVVDLDQRLAHFNPAAAALFGWDARAGRGQPADQALADWPELAAALRGEPLPGELARGLGADRRVFEPALTPLTDPRGRRLGQVLTLRDTTEHRRVEDELARRATTDELTGLADRRHFFQALGDEARRARRYDAPLALLLLDLDRLRTLNDQFGRLAGDEALRAVARALQRLARQSDLPARYGGDEFALILPNTNLLGAETVAGRLAAAAAQVQLADAGPQLGLSVGAAELAPTDDDQGESLLARAEKAVRAAQTAGGGRVMVEEQSYAQNQEDD